MIRFTFLFSIIISFLSCAQVEHDDEIIDTSIVLIPSKSNLVIPPFKLINTDTLKIGEFDEFISSSYCALGVPAVYDALHYFQTRRMDNFGGHLNDKINIGLENIRKKGFKSDVKQFYIQIDPKTLVVYWFAVVGPSADGKCYVRVNSRGSAGGGLPAVQGQLSGMHSHYPTLTDVKFFEFNENVIKCFDWNGKPLSNCSGYVNIRQHFYKYYDSQVDVTITLEEYTKKYPCSTQGSNLPGKKKKFVVTTRYRKYKVKSGDTLSGIAKKYRTTVAKIKKVNGLRSNIIRTGQVLKIP